MRRFRQNPKSRGHAFLGVSGVRLPQRQSSPNGTPFPEEFAVVSGFAKPNKASVPASELEITIIGTFRACPPPRVFHLSSFILPNVLALAQRRPSEIS
jgi:hypothetical protein